MSENIVWRDPDFRSASSVLASCYSHDIRWRVYWLSWYDLFVHVDPSKQWASFPVTCKGLSINIDTWLLWCQYCHINDGHTYGFVFKSCCKHFCGSWLSLDVQFNNCIVVCARALTSIFLFVLSDSCEKSTDSCSFLTCQLMKV